MGPAPPQGPLPTCPLQPDVLSPQMKAWSSWQAPHSCCFLPGQCLSPCAWGWPGQGGRAYIPVCLPTPCQVTRTVEGRWGRGQVGVNKWEKWGRRGQVRGWGGCMVTGWEAGRQAFVEAKQVSFRPITGSFFWGVGQQSWLQGLQDTGVLVFLWKALTYEALSPQ